MKMNKIFTALLLLAISFIGPLNVTAQRSSFPEMKQLQGPQNPRLGMVIHGGAGVIRKGSLSPEREKQYRAKMEEALMAGYKALQAGKSSVDAVEIAIKILEDSPLFNAGKGAVFTHDGKNSLDTSIMNGKTLAAGAAAGLEHVKNPITLARAVMERSPHVMLYGAGAEEFAKEQGIELVDAKYFFTQPRYDALQKILKQENEKEKKEKSDKVSSVDTPFAELPENKFGTVGAIALDKDGNLAAGTSTGGMTNKRWGRIGDSPIIGAGTYADNNTCAVSATGWGEFFIRLSVARDIAAQMEYRAMTVQAAADTVIQRKLAKLGGDGGVIAMDKFGNIGISFNSEGMYRGYIDKDGKPVVEIYK